MTPLAFYTPVKHPFQTEPSGDREIGRVLMAALSGIGFAPRLASRLLTYRRAFDPGDAARVERIAALTATRLIARYRRGAPEARPRVWVTYQSYYRAPDLIGPTVAAALGIPYVLVDTAVSTGSRRTPFRPWVSAARLAVRRADLVFVMSPRDRPRVAACRGPRFAAERLLDLPPTIDATRFDATAQRRAACRAAMAGRFPGADGPVILAVAAMREMKKLDAYRLLGGALGRLHALAPARPWRLAVVGDGPARPAVAATLGALPAGRVAFLGSLEPDVLPDAYFGADLFAFPGRFHVVYLQAAAAGLPVVACAGPGSDPMVAPDGALLTPPTPDAFAAGVARLLGDPGLRNRWGRPPGASSDRPARSRHSSTARRRPRDPWASRAFRLRRADPPRARRANAGGACSRQRIRRLSPEVPPARARWRLPADLRALAEQERLGWAVSRSGGPSRRANPQAVAPLVEPRLAEQDWGDWTGRARTAVARETSAAGWDAAPPGGESPAQVLVRVRTWLDELAPAAGPDTWAAVTHMGVIRTILAAALRWNLEGSPPVRLLPDRLHRVRRRGDGLLQLVGLNEPLDP